MRREIRRAGAALTIASSLALGGCASKLDREPTDNAPQGGLEQALDLSLIDFLDVRTREPINVKAYMEQEGRDYLLLTFGSKSCSACNEKAAHLKSDVIGRHSLYLTEPGQRFEIVGVSTDPEPFARIAGHVEQYPFIKWSDPSGDVMVGSFMPAGHRFQVPLTVMVTAEGIVWRVMPDDPLSVEAIMSRVESTLGLHGGGTGTDTGSGTGGGSGSGSGTGGGTDPVTATGLAVSAPGRLKKVGVERCDGTRVALDETMARADVRFVSVTKGACGEDCEANRVELARVVAKCAEAGGVAGRTCAVASLSTEAAGSAACGSGIALTGGAEFFEVFQSHFDWDRVEEGPPPDYKLSLKPIDEPMVLGFDAKGRLVFSQLGRLGEGALEIAMRAKTFGDIARGPDFALRGQYGEFRFADWRRKARYTVVAAFGTECGSCIPELQHWSKDDELAAFCRERPADCQVGALEIHQPDDGRTLSQYYDGILHGDGRGFDGFETLGIEVPLVLDPVPINGPTGTEYLKRFFDGYMLAKYPELGYEYRTLIYDQEGKIVARFKAEAPTGKDPVLATLKTLLK